jgi:hypothetical protein
MMIHRRGGWLQAKVGDAYIMMSADSGDYIGLSEVGSRIWEMIEAPQDFDTLCTLLEEEFEVAPDVCRAEVESFLRVLAENEAVTLDPPLPT